MTSDGGPEQRTRTAADHCRFSTDRLDVDEWHTSCRRHDLDLVAVIGRVLTTATTTALPTEWHGHYDADRAARWLRLRDAESPTLLAVDRATGVPAGLLILFERATDDHVCELRIGYVLAEDCWGRGLATELVGGLVDWARSEPTIGSVSAGVARLNPASARVLVVNGFQPVEGGEDTQEYRRILR